MSYDLRLGVKVDGAEDLYAVIARPENDSPTYNLREMFVKCMDWNYTQGKWYRVSDVLPHIQRGINELTWKPKQYEKYNSLNGWGTIKSALEALTSLADCIRENAAETSEHLERDTIRPDVYAVVRRCLKL